MTGSTARKVVLAATLAVVLAGCSAFDPPQSPAEIVTHAADTHAKACDLYRAACAAEGRACRPEAEAACAVRCAP